MRFPAYGNALWQRRLLGERPRVAYLFVGDYWKKPKWLELDLSPIPKLAVKTSPWHEPRGDRFDWRLVVGMTILAIDTRGPDERAQGEGAWDAWFWLLADVQQFARDVLIFTPTIEFTDPPAGFADERNLETYAWLNREFDGEARAWAWPPWWPHGDAVFARGLPELAA